MKKLQKTQLDATGRRLAKLVLEAARIEYKTSSSGETAIVALDDLYRLVLDVIEQHHQVHEMQMHLCDSCPEVRLYRALSQSCEDHHTRYPVTDALTEFAKELNEEQETKARREAQEGLTTLLNRLGIDPVNTPHTPPDPKDVN